VISLGQRRRLSASERYLRIARPEIDELALGEPRLPITLARELDLDAPGAVPALQLDAHHVPERPHVADHRLDAATVGMAIDIDLVGTRVDLGRDIIDAVVMLQIDRDVPDSGPALADPPVEKVHIAQKMIDEGARGPDVDLVGGPVLLHVALDQDDDAIGDLEGVLLVVGDEHGRDVQLVVQTPESCPWKSRLGAGALLRFGGGRLRSIRNRVRMNRSRSRVYAELHHLQPERGARLEPGCVVVQMRQFDADAGAVG
jgi:hypothetical protein